MKSRTLLTISGLQAELQYSFFKAQEVMAHLDYREKGGFTRTTTTFYPRDSDRNPFPIIVYVAIAGNVNYLGKTKRIEFNSGGSSICKHERALRYFTYFRFICVQWIRGLQSCWKPSRTRSSGGDGEDHSFQSRTIGTQRRLPPKSVRRDERNCARSHRRSPQLLGASRQKAHKEGV